MIYDLFACQRLPTQKLFSARTSQEKPLYVDFPTFFQKCQHRRSNQQFEKNWTHDQIKRKKQFSW